MLNILRSFKWNSLITFNSSAYSLTGLGKCANKLFTRCGKGLNGWRILQDKHNTLLVINSFTYNYETVSTSAAKLHCKYVFETIPLSYTHIISTYIHHIDETFCIYTACMCTRSNAYNCFKLVAVESSSTFGLSLI